MIEPLLRHVVCPDAPGGEGAGTRPSTHRMAYWQWGDPTADHVLICVHGLSRQGRDFDVLANALCARAGGRLRVICPDVVGRGRSDWLANPMNYQIPVYAMDMLALTAQLHGEAPMTTLDWLGTSMGGLIGMVIAGQPGLPLPVPVRRMVLNDVGPSIQWEALQRIGTYLGQTGRFDSLQAAADALWAVSTSFGPHTPAQWLALSEHMVKPVDAGSSGVLTLHYDPAIAVPFKTLTADAAKAGEAALWQLYDGIRAKVLVTRGAQSDLLSADTAKAMTERGPQARLVEFAGVGHAPTFVAKDQVEAAVDWILSDVLDDERLDEPQ